MNTVKGHGVRRSRVGSSLLAKWDTLALVSPPATCPVHHNRGTLRRRLQQFDPAVEDFLKAMDMVTDTQDSLVKQAQRQLLLTYNDFAVHCYTHGAYQEGVLLLNKAIRDEQNEKGLYINRGGELGGGQALANSLRSPGWSPAMLRELGMHSNFALGS